MSQPSAEVYEFLFKFLIIGSASTGKSSLLHQFLENKFKNDITHTIGAEFGSKIVHVNQKNIKLQIWDTAGQERFRSVTRSYYRGASGALLVYDITNRATFEAVANWLTDARSLASPNIVIILCGNKKDLESQRQVTHVEAMQFAQENDLMFVETSAVSSEGVTESFLQCAQKIISKIQSGNIDPHRMYSGVQYNRSLTATTAADAVAATPHRTIPNVSTDSSVIYPSRDERQNSSRNCSC